MAKKKFVPKRRFEGFESEWQTTILDELGSFGKTYSFSRADEGYGKYSHVHYGDIHVKFDGLINKETELPSLKVDGHFEFLKNNDIVIADASEDYVDLGKAVVIEDIDNRKVIASSHTFKFTPNNHLDSKFYLYYSQSRLFKKFSYQKGTGISVFGISKDNLSKMKFNIPVKKEQQKIGEFFKHLDETIALQQKKIDKTNALKSAYLAEMFPVEGERIPKRRFDGFNKEWEKQTLNEVAYYRNGKAHEQNVVIDGKYIIVNSKFVSTNGYTKKCSNRQIEPLLKGEIAFVLSDVPNGRAVARTYLIEKNNKYTLNQRIAGITPKENTDSYFLKELMNRHKYFLNFDDGVSQTNISNADMERFEAYYPDFKEQQKIGKFFKSLDNMITNHQQKLYKLKATKQAYLNEMFV